MVSKLKFLGVAAAKFTAFVAATSVAVDFTAFSGGAKGSQTMALKSLKLK